MCGINGIYSYGEGAPPVDPDELIRTRDAMRARGPDGAGAWYSPDRRLGLGHRRLAIIDLSDLGAQPMSSADGRFTVVFNGEIYNYRELRAELLRDGVPLRSHSDTEVLLHLWRREGEAMLHRLRGMFAFALWDESRRSLFLARDPHGIKPLYYADDGRSFRFASQVQALLAGRALPRQVSAGGLVGFLEWGSVPEPLTFYRNIRALAAGHSLRVDAHAARAPQAYWRLGDAISRSVEDAAAVPRGEEIDYLREALTDSVRAHLVADVPVGAFLSAGLDSSTLVGLAQETGAAVQTFTVTADELHGKPSDEAPAAAEIARHFGLPHTVANLSLANAGETVPAFLAAMDQPTVDGINTWFVTAAARRAGLKVVISGLGGDELLGGYQTFEHIPALCRRRGLPGLPGAASAYHGLHAQLARVMDAKPARDAEKWLAAGDLRHAYRWQRGLFMPWELPRLVAPDVLRAGQDELRGAATWDPVAPELNCFSQVSLLESSRYMRNQLLRDSDWIGMAHSLELRTPLVDRRLSERVSGLAALGRLGQGKTGLPKTLARGLPASILGRPKMGFTLPIWTWLHKVEELAGWRRNPWLCRRATNPFARWGYAVLSGMPELDGSLR